MMKNYHIVRVVPLVNFTLRKKLNGMPELQELSYQEIQTHLFEQHYCYGGGFSHEMRRLGNRCEELVFDFELLQRKWSEENDANIDFGSHWQLKVVLAQLQQLDPDFIFLQGFTRISPKDIFAHKHLFPNLKKIMVHSGYPGLVSDFSPDTIVFCGLPMICDIFKKEGLETHLLYHGFDTRIADKLSGETKTIPFSFVGSSGYGHGEGHKVRYWELMKLANNAPMSVWLDDKDDFLNGAAEQSPFIERPLKDHFYDIQDDDFSRYPNPLAPLRYFIPEEAVNGPLYGMDYYRTLASSSVTYHRHGKIPEVGAMRLFEATGVGTCLMTDNGSNLSQLFEEDNEIVTYESLPDCYDKLKYLLDNPHKAREIGENAKKRTLRDHSLENRYQQVHQILQQYCV